MTGQDRRSPTANAMSVLQAVARLGFGTTAQEVCAYLQMPPATLYRILNTLVGEEYLVRTSDLRGFGLGRASSMLVEAIAPPVVTTSAREAIEESRASVRFGVHVLEFREFSLAVADEDADHPLRARAELTRTLHASAAGKLLLSQLPDWRTVRRRGPLVQVTAHTTVIPDLLDAEVDSIRSRGYSIALNELQEGLACIAVPVGREGQPARAALCLAGPSERLNTMVGLASWAREVASRLAPLLY